MYRRQYLGVATAVGSVALGGCASDTSDTEEDEYDCTDEHSEQYCTGQAFAEDIEQEFNGEDGPNVFYGGLVVENDEVVEDVGLVRVVPSNAASGNTGAYSLTKDIGAIAQEYATLSEGFGYPLKRLRIDFFAIDQETYVGNTIIRKEWARSYNNGEIDSIEYSEKILDEIYVKDDP